MCGIVGIAADRDGADERRRIVETMAATLKHRGPDSTGTWADPESTIALGFRRLSILDLSPAGNQPMTSRSGRWVIVFNGEIYNHRRLRTELESEGAQFRGHSDTETLVEAIDAWGFEATLHRTNAMFAIAAWDRNEHRLLLARDRLGEKPIYWMNQGGRFAFASELRALRVMPGAELTIDPAAATALLHWSFVPHPATIYADVRQVPPGGIVDVDLSSGRPSVDERQWWTLVRNIERAMIGRRAVTIDSAAEELEPLLADAVAMRMDADVPLGVFLSGGVDSSLIAALAQRASSTAVNTFTVRMPELGFDESGPAQAVARYLGTNHEVVDMSLTETLARVPELATTWDEPFADPSMLPSIVLCEAAGRKLTVCLGGDGGDELFAGYNRHAIGTGSFRLATNLPAGPRRLLSRALLAPSPGTVERVSGALSRLLPAARRLPNLHDKVQKAGMLLNADHDAWEALVQIWPVEPLLVAPLRPAVPTLEGSLEPIEELMLADTATVLPDQMLVKVDRASMAFALEVRVPFLDHRVLDWSWQQPMSVKAGGGVGKLVLRRMSGKLLPPGTDTRPKMGFDPPLANWLRNELHPWAADHLASPRSVAEGWIDGAELQTVWQEHQSGRRNWDYRLWGVLMLESWLAEHHPA